MQLESFVADGVFEGPTANLFARMAAEKQLKSASRPRLLGLGSVAALAVGAVSLLCAGLLTQRMYVDEAALLAGLAESELASAQPAARPPWDADTSAGEKRAWLLGQLHGFGAEPLVHRSAHGRGCECDSISALVKAQRGDGREAVLLSVGVECAPPSATVEARAAALVVQLASHLWRSRLEVRTKKRQRVAALPSHRQLVPRASRPIGPKTTGHACLARVGPAHPICAPPPPAVARRAALRRAGSRRTFSCCCPRAAPAHPVRAASRPARGGDRRRARAAGASPRRSATSSRSTTWR